MAVPRSLLTMFVAAALSLGAASCTSKTETPEEKAARITKLVVEADTRLRNNKVEDAEKIYTRILEEDPEQPDAMGGLGRLRFEQNKFVEAEKLLTAALKTKADDAALWAALGRTLELQDKHSESADAFAKAFDLNGEDMDVGLSLGRELKRASRLDEAEPILRKVSEEDPRAQYVFTELADVLREKGQADAALKLYMKAQNEYRSDRMARAGAALIYEAKGDNKHALDEWSAYIRMDCCSDYSNDVAKKKMLELDEPGRPDGEPPAPAADDATAPVD